MHCIFCGSPDSRVVDSRSSDDGKAIRRRRECDKCGRRFTTYEKADTVPMMVIKKDGRRQAFDSEKLRNGILKACEKRPVSIDAINHVVNTIETKAYAADREVTSSEIGEMVMSELKKLDGVSYVRFASVYREFADLGTFLDEVRRLVGTENIK